jgi:predicted deacylase
MESQSIKTVGIIQCVAAPYAVEGADRCNYRYRQGTPTLLNRNRSFPCRRDLADGTAADRIVIYLLK